MTDKLSRYSAIPLFRLSCDLLRPARSCVHGQEADALAEVREALEKAESTFERYSKLHIAKGTRDGDQKAAINMALAMEMGEALAKLEGKGK